MARRDLDISVGRLRLAGVSASPRPRQEGLWVPSRRSFSDFEALWGPIGRYSFAMPNEEAVREGRVSNALIRRLHSLRMEIRTRKKSSLYQVNQKVFRPSSADPLQIYTTEFNNACRELGKGEAGRRARNLLFEFLDEDQRKDAETKGYFDVILVPSEPVEPLLKECEDLGVKAVLALSSIKFRILRYSTDVQEFRHSPRTRSGWQYSFSVCIHPPQPHPYDDIALGQLIELTRHPDEFVKIANYWLAGQSVGFEGETMFNRWRPDGSPIEDLALPYLRPRTQAILGLDRIGRRMQETLDAMEYLR